MSRQLKIVQKYDRIRDMEVQFMGYSLEQRQRILKMHLEEGYTISGLSREIGISRGTIHNWLNEYLTDPERKKQAAKSKQKYSKSQEIQIKKNMLLKEIEMQIDVLQSFRKELERWDLSV